MNVALYNGGNNWNTNWLTPFDTFNTPKGIDFVSITTGTSGSIACSNGNPCDVIMVADTNNNRIIVISFDQVPVIYGTQGTLYRPIGLSYFLKTANPCSVLNPCDIMFIADTYNNRIIQVAANNGAITLRGVGNWGNIAPASFSVPHGVVCRYIYIEHY